MLYFLRGKCHRCVRFALEFFAPDRLGQLVVFNLHVARANTLRGDGGVECRGLPERDLEQDDGEVFDTAYGFSSYLVFGN